MINVVRVLNSTGNPRDTEIIVGGEKLPLSHLMRVDISIRPDEVVVATVELMVDDIDMLSALHTQE